MNPHLKHLQETNVGNILKKNSEDIATLIDKDRFDEHYRNKDFVKGPFNDTFGDNYGEHYNPNRQAFGRLKDERIVYCELSKSLQGKF